MMKILKKWFRLSLSKGFTLIELLIVVAIIGILTALVTTNLQGVRERARDTRRKSDLRTIQQSLRLYYNDAKRFPASSTSYKIEGCNTINVPEECNWGSAFATTTTTYMTSLPLDPSNSDTVARTYNYEAVSDDQYILVASLENESDLDIAESQSRCSTVYTSYNGPKDASTDYVLCAQ